MSAPAEEDEVVRVVEALILAKFQAEPFHNLYLRFDYPRTTLAYGGTCSDKVLSFHEALRSLGVAGTLHSAFIDDAEIHRLVQVRIGDALFFADVGNGWPSVKMFPLDHEVEYRCYGMRFRSVIHGRRMSIYNTRTDVERLQMDIHFDCKSEREILTDIEGRFGRGVDYPFSKGLRFSQVIGDRFLFLRDDRLEIYSSSQPYEEILGLDVSRLRETIQEHFGFDIEVLAAARGGRPAP